MWGSLLIKPRASPSIRLSHAKLRGDPQSPQDATLPNTIGGSFSTVLSDGGGITACRLHFPVVTISMRRFCWRPRGRGIRHHRVRVA